MANKVDIAAERLAEAERLLRLSEDQLYEALGKEGHEHAIPSDLRRWGRDRYRAISARLRSDICEDTLVHTVWNTEGGQRMATLVCLVADFISGAPATTAATLIVKQGLDSYCKDFWKGERDG